MFFSSANLGREDENRPLSLFLTLRDLFGFNLSSLEVLYGNCYRRIERRRHRRLQGKDGALLSLGVELKRVWHLIDISEGGLASR